VRPSRVCSSSRANDRDFPARESFVSASGFPELVRPRFVRPGHAQSGANSSLQAADGEIGTPMSWKSANYFWASICCGRKFESCARRKSFQGVSGISSFSERAEIAPTWPRLAGVVAATCDRETIYPRKDRRFLTRFSAAAKVSPNRFSGTRNSARGRKRIVCFSGGGSAKADALHSGALCRHPQKGSGRLGSVPAPNRKLPGYCWEFPSLA
jgi:hypothetical protein